MMYSKYILLVLLMLVVIIFSYIKNAKAETIGYNDYSTWASRYADGGALHELQLATVQKVIHDSTDYNKLATEICAASCTQSSACINYFYSGGLVGCHLSIAGAILTVKPYIGISAILCPPGVTTVDSTGSCVATSDLEIKSLGRSSTNPQICPNVGGN